MSSDCVDGETVTPVGNTVVAVGTGTVIVHVAVFAPVFVLTVMIASPTALAVTSPELDTVATAVLLLPHVTLLSVALLGETVEVS